MSIFIIVIVLLLFFLQRSSLKGDFYLTRVISRTDFNPKNPEEFQRNFASNIKILLDDETLAKTMGKDGRKRVLEKFSWESIAKTTYNYYKEVISKFEKEKA